MKKASPITYESAVTFGRFNIAHSGHVELIQRMLRYAEVAYVGVSAGALNNDWDLRVLLLRVLCRSANVNLSRVCFIKSTSPFDVVQHAIRETEHSESVIVLGTDQVTMASKLGDVFDCPVILNSRTNSSTQTRFFLDTEDFREDLIHLYDGDEYATTLAMILRREEKDRERSAETATETQNRAQRVTPPPATA